MPPAVAIPVAIGIAGISAATTAQAAGRQNKRLREAEANAAAAAEASQAQVQQRGQIQRTQIIDEAQRRRGRIRAVFADRGIDPSIGTPTRIETQSSADAAFEADVSNLTQQQALDTIRRETRQEFTELALARRDPFVEGFSAFVGGASTGVSLGLSGSEIFAA